MPDLYFRRRYVRVITSTYCNQFVKVSALWCLHCTPQQGSDGRPACVPVRRLLHAAKAIVCTVILKLQFLSNKRPSHSGARNVDVTQQYLQPAGTTCSTMATGTTISSQPSSWRRQYYRSITSISESQKLRLYTPARCTRPVKGLCLLTKLRLASPWPLRAPAVGPAAHVLRAHYSMPHLSTNPRLQQPSNSSNQVDIGRHAATEQQHTNTLPAADAVCSRLRRLKACCGHQLCQEKQSHCFQ